MKKPVVGFAMCGSFCTFRQVIDVLKLLPEQYDVVPILSPNAASIDSRFGRAADFRAEVEEICGREAITTIGGAEPIGPKKLLDLLLIAPCTGNSLAKLAHGISDTCVTLAYKSHLRNARPALIAVSTNDALSQNAASIGTLMARRHTYFVPFAQDDAEGKPTSLVAKFELIPASIEAALEGRQLQPLLRG